MPSRERVLSETYAATTQRESADSRDEGWRYDYLGRLRLDLIAFRQVVIPDSHLFDGLYFLTSDPSVLLPAITRVGGQVTAPLVVKARQQSLSASLGQLLRRDEFLNGFPFNSLADGETAARLAGTLRQTPARRLEDAVSDDNSVAAGLARFLREVTEAEGLDAGESLDKMEAGWTRWLAAERRGAVAVEQWSRPFDLPRALPRSYIDPAEIRHARATLNAVWRLLRGESTYRGDVSALLRDASIGASSEELAELHRIESWARRARHWALAEQHECSLRSRVELTDAYASRFGRLVDALRGDDSKHESLELPADFVRRLGQLPTDEFRLSLDLSALADWWADRDRTQLRNALERVAEAVDGKVAPSRDHPQFVEHLSELVVEVPATLAGTALGAAVGGVAGAGVGTVVGASAGKFLAAYGATVVHGDPRRRVVRQLVEYIDR